MIRKRLTVQEILQVLEGHRAELLRFQVLRLGVFGSVVHGTDTGESDIDFLVTLGKNTFDNYMGLKLYLEDLFGRDVDLVTEDSVKPDLAYIKEEAVYATTR